MINCTVLNVEYNNNYILRKDQCVYLFHVYTVNKTNSCQPYR